MKEEKPKYLQVLQKNIRQLRKQKELTQVQLGELINMNQTHYSQLEVGNSEPRLNSIYKVSSALGVEMHELFRENVGTNLSHQQIFARLLDMNEANLDPLMVIIEVYLRDYEANKGIHPKYRERYQELQEIRISKE